MRKLGIVNSTLYKALYELLVQGRLELTNHLPARQDCEAGGFSVNLEPLNLEPLNGYLIFMENTTNEKLYCFFHSLIFYSGSG